MYQQKAPFRAMILKGLEDSSLRLATFMSDEKSLHRAIYGSMSISL